MTLANDIARCNGVGCEKRIDCERFLQRHVGRLFFQPAPFPDLTCTAQIKANDILKKSDK